MIDFNKSYNDMELKIFNTCMFCKKGTEYSKDILESKLPYSSFPKNTSIIHWYVCKPCNYTIKAYNGFISAAFKIKENDKKRKNDLMIVVDLSGARLMDKGAIIRMLNHSMDDMMNVVNSYRVLV